LACAWAPPDARLAGVQTTAPAEGIADSSPYGGLYDPGFSSGAPGPWLERSLALQAKLDPLPPATAAKSPLLASLEADWGPSSVTDQPSPRPSLTDSIPLPPSRPPELAAPSSPPVAAPRFEPRVAKAPVPATAPDNRTFLQKLLGLPQQNGSAVAYAAPETSVARGFRPTTAAPAPSIFGAFSTSSLMSRFDRYTAVYDISAHVVYLPNGTRLEAHSGLGERLDDPRFANERGRGVTPPHLYDLTPREASFHGVQALRLNPVGDGDLFGRAGLLAHSYMLGPNGDSNGCVSFRDYDAFLQAYQSGQVKRLAVVARLN
jgi:hypothetical protein